MLSGSFITLPKTIALRRSYHVRYPSLVLIRVNLIGDTFFPVLLYPDKISLDAFHSDQFLIFLKGLHGSLSAFLDTDSIKLKNLGISFSVFVCLFMLVCFFSSFFFSLLFFFSSYWFDFVPPNQESFCAAQFLYYAFKLRFYVAPPISNCAEQKSIAGNFTR